MSSKTLKTLSALVLASTLVACASSGNMQIKDVNQETVASQITKGVTTKDDVRRAYGSPKIVNFTDNGNEIWNYAYEFAKAKPVNFVPVVNSFVQGADVDTKQLAIIFDSKGVVKNYSFNESTSETYAGIAAGIAAPKNKTAAQQ